MKAFGILAPGGDTTPPTVPQNPTATALSSTAIAVTWQPSTDNVGVSGYQVYRDNVPVHTLAGTTWTDTGLAAGTLYSYRIAAYDAAGNVSALSTAASATTASNSAPTWTDPGDQALGIDDGYFLDLGALVSDADGDPITISLASGSLPTGLSFNAGLKTVSGVPSVNLESTTATFAASDGIAPAVNLTIAFRVSNLPVWSVAENYDLGEQHLAGSAASVPLSAYTYDADGDLILYTRTGGTAPAGVTVDETTGVVTVPADTPSGTYTIEITLRDEAPANEIVHGSLLTITGSGFGTRANNNAYGATWYGYSHLHAAWCDFSTDKRGDDTQSAWRSALGGMYPKYENSGSAYRLDGGGYSNTGNAIISGGPSQSGYYYKRYYDGNGVNGYYQGVVVDVPNPSSIVEYWCCKMRREGPTAGTTGPTGRGVAKTIRATSMNGFGAGNYYLSYADDTYGAVYSEYNPAFDAITPINVYAAGFPQMTWKRLAFCSNGTTQVFKAGTSELVWDNSYMADPGLSSMPFIKAGEPTGYVVFGSQMGFASVPGVANDGHNFADIYYDKTPARVEVEQGSVIEIQPVNSWADTSITIIGNKGELSAGAGTLNVYDATNSVIHTQAIVIN